MAKINGGIIGPNNPTGPFSAGGVWRLEDAFNAQKAGTWPVVLGYQIPNSLRFDSGSSDKLEKALTGTDGNRQIWTFSSWVKRAKLGTAQTIFSFSENTSAEGQLYFDANDFLVLLNDFQNGSSNETDMKFRDVGAWYHIVWACDSTQSTNANRWKLYVNGTQVTLTGSPTITQNGNGIINAWASHDCWIGANARSQQAGNPTQYADIYLSETYFIDGQQLDVSSFGETDSTTGIWKPKAYTGTFGTRGFYLKFANSASLGTDSSGNGNNFTASNLTSIDQSYDSPTNNFATGNPLLYRPTYGWATLSEGNLKHSSAGLTTSWGGMMSNIIPSSGKWYAEVYCQGNAAGIIGVANAGTLNVDYFMVQNPQLRTGFWGINYNAGGSRIQNGSDIVDANVTNFMSNGIVGIALDCSNKTLTMYIDGSVISTVNGLNIINTAATDAFAFMSLTANGTASVFNWNFGYPPFTISSGNADANGFGNFEYAVPSGYYALCSKNLALYG